MSDQTTLTPEQAARWVALHGFTLYVTDRDTFIGADSWRQERYPVLLSPRLYFLWRAKESEEVGGQGWVVTKVGEHSDAFTDELTIEILEQAVKEAFARELDPYWEPVPLHGEPHD